MASRKKGRAKGQTATTISLPEDLLRWLKAKSDSENRTVSNFVVTELTKLREKADATSSKKEP